MLKYLKELINKKQHPKEQHPKEGDIRIEYYEEINEICEYCNNLIKIYEQKIFTIKIAPNGNINKFWKKTGKKFEGCKDCGNLQEIIIIKKEK